MFLRLQDRLFRLFIRLTFLLINFKRIFLTLRFLSLLFLLFALLDWLHFIRFVEYYLLLFIASLFDRFHSLSFIMLNRLRDYFFNRWSNFFSHLLFDKAKRLFPRFYLLWAFFLQELSQEVCQMRDIFEGLPRGLLTNSPRGFLPPNLVH